MFDDLHTTIDMQSPIDINNRLPNITISAFLVMHRTARTVTICRVVLGGRPQAKSCPGICCPRHPHARASLYHFARTARRAKTARATRTNYADGTDSMDCTMLLSHCHHTAYGDCSLPCRCSLQNCPLQTFIACLLKLPHFLQYQSFPTRKRMSRGHLHVFLLQNPRNRQL